MENAARTLVVVTAAVVGFGLVPCLGWLNWFGVPLALCTAVVGIAGLVTDRDEASRVRHADLYLVAILVGVGGAALGALRGFLGGGCF